MNHNMAPDTWTDSDLIKLDPSSLVLKKEDLEEKFVRSGGKGGQNVNKVATCVQLTHTPTGLSVSCSESRTQGKNRIIALGMLTNKITDKIQKLLAQKKKDRRPTKNKWAHKTKANRLENKKRTAQTKQNRKPPSHE